MLLTLLPFLLLALPSHSQRTPLNGACSQQDSRLDLNTGAYLTSCDAQTYCAPSGVCLAKGCRKDEFPFGYAQIPFGSLPPLCPRGFFCPDEEDTCLPQIPVGQPCQLDRDDECAPPPEWRSLAGKLNTNGSICLNFSCHYANRTLSTSCEIENRAYAAYTDSAGGSVAVLVSRDDCANGMYCDGSALQCFAKRVVGGSCRANKECLTYNCSKSGTCLDSTDAPDRPATYVYVLVALAVVLLIAGVSVGLGWVHKRDRRENQVRLEQYYTEQIAYRQSIMSLHQARNSLLNLPPRSIIEHNPSKLSHESPLLPTSPYRPFHSPTHTHPSGFPASPSDRSVSTDGRGSRMDWTGSDEGGGGSEVHLVQGSPGRGSPGRVGGLGVGMGGGGGRGEGKGRWGSKGGSMMGGRM